MLELYPLSTDVRGQRTTTDEKQNAKLAPIMFGRLRSRPGA